MSQEPMLLGVDYHSKLQRLTLGGIEPDTGMPMTKQITMRLGDFLRSLDLTGEDCGRAIEASAVTEPQVRKINPLDWRQIDALPADLSGHTVLDLGGYDGYVSAACLARGAVRAVVIDNQQYQRYTLEGYPYGWIAPHQLAGVEYVNGDLMDFSTWLDYTNLGDVVLCLNVIYHVPDPFGALQRLRLLTKGELYISSAITDDELPDWRWSYDETKQFFYTPSQTALEKGLKAVGFSEVELLFKGEEGEAMYRCK